MTTYCVTLHRLQYEMKSYKTQKKAALLATTAIHTPSASGQTSQKVADLMGWPAYTSSMSIASSFCSRRQRQRQRFVTRCNEIWINKYKNFTDFWNSSLRENGPSGRTSSRDGPFSRKALHDNGFSWRPSRRLSGTHALAVRTARWDGPYERLVRIGLYSASGVQTYKINFSKMYKLWEVFEWVKGICHCEYNII